MKMKQLRSNEKYITLILLYAIFMIMYREMMNGVLQFDC